MKQTKKIFFDLFFLHGFFVLRNMTLGFLNVCKFMLPVASIKIGALIEQTRISDTFAQKLLKLINYTYNQKSRGPTGPDF